MRLTDDERASYERDGFLVRDKAFSRDEVEELRTATEELCADVAAGAGQRKVRVSRHYIFEAGKAQDIIIKWEPGSEDVVQGLEPFAHLHPTFTRYLGHPAFVEPCADLLGLPEVEIFTEKLNVKRAHVGGSYALHQDHPYWVDPADDAVNMVTVWVALDDATTENGALEVLPGSHKLGHVSGKESDLPFERNEIDERTVDVDAMVSVEVPAGGAVFFGPFLVHRSAPNHSDADRRAVLYTYQAPGLRTQRQNLHQSFNRT